MEENQRKKLPLRRCNWGSGHGFGTLGSDHELYEYRNEDAVTSKRDDLNKLSGVEVVVALTIEVGGTDDTTRPSPR